MSHSVSVLYSLHKTWCRISSVLCVIHSEVMGHLLNSYAVNMIMFNITVTWREKCTGVKWWLCVFIPWYSVSSLSRARFVSVINPSAVWLSSCSLLAVCCHLSPLHDIFSFVSHLSVQLLSLAFCSVWYCFILPLLLGALRQCQNFLAWSSVFWLCTVGRENVCG